MAKVKNEIVHQPCGICGRGSDEGEGWSVIGGGFATIYKHDTCPEKVCTQLAGKVAWNRRPCGKDGKGQDDSGKWLCGIHFAAYNKRTATSARWKDERARGNANLKRAQLALDVLTELDIKGTAHHNRDGYTGNIVIDPADLFRLASIGVTLPKKE